MTNTSTKRALLSSVVSLFLCFVMLMGTTFAWFTDVAVSEGNVIQAGELKVELWQHFDGKDSINLGENNTAIFGASDSDKANSDSADTLWEPGKTQTAYLSIKNKGSLDLKYTVAIEVTNITNGINEVLTYVISPDATVENPVLKGDLNWTTGSAVENGVNITSAQNVALTAGSEHFFALSVHMDELAGNEYQNGNITFNIKVLAGQLVSEEDSFGNDYDEDAGYSDGFYVVPTDENFPVAGFEIPHYDDNNFKNGTIVITKESVTPGSVVFYDMLPIAKPDYIVLNGDAQAVAYDIQVSGLVENNNADIYVQIRLPDDADPAKGISVYHNGTLIPSSYIADSNMVNFSTKSFSPFTVVYNGTAEVVTDTTVPVANVTYEEQYVGEGKVTWGNYGGWSPTEGLDSDLEAAFTFKAPHDSDSVDLSAYKNWECDFYVSLRNADPDDASNPFINDDGSQNYIFLGGNYGGFGWVGFHFTAEEGDYVAGDEIGLLEAVTTDPWTYDAIATSVNTFICGVGDHNDQLDGCVFTVMLRLTNPEDSSDYINVNTVTYTFGGDYVMESYTPAN